MSNVASKQRQIDRWSKLLQPKSTFLTCAICETTDLNNNFKKFYANDIFCAGTIIRHQCPNCSLIFGDLRFLNLSEDEISKDHEDTYSYFSEGLNNDEKYSCLSAVEVCLNKKLSYLDYACGSGIFTNYLLKNNYNVNGYDKYVKGKNVLNNIYDQKFDIIFSINFIEHLIDPINQIKDMLNHLNSDGYLIFMSDCIDEYKIEYTHFHTYYYVGESFNVLCDKLDLTIVESKIIGNYRIKVLRIKK